MFDRLKEIDDHVRVILTTGYTQDSETRAILMSGVKAFIQKNLQMDGLVGTIRGILSS